MRTSSYLSVSVSRVQLSAPGSRLRITDSLFDNEQRPLGSNFQLYRVPDDTVLRFSNAVLRDCIKIRSHYLSYVLTSKRVTITLVMADMPVHCSLFALTLPHRPSRRQS
jgi:hypothetical protein